MRLLVCVLLLCLPSAGVADEKGRFYVNFGYDDLFQRRKSSAAAAVEYLTPGFGPGGNFRLAFSGMATADIDLWVGAGLSWGRQINDGPWFFELSLLPGVFYRADERPGVDRLHIPMFRTQASIGYMFENNRSISMAVSHHSSASIDTDAGNTETVWIRYGMEF